MEKDKRKGAKIEPFKPDFKHHNNRRKRNHDYRAPWKYHITICKAPFCPDFSLLQWQELTKDDVTVKNTEIGSLIWKAIRTIPVIEPKVQVYQYVIMPDHIHILLRVKERMDNLLGKVIHDFKTRATSSIRQHTSSPELIVFTENYNDKIIYPDRNLNDIFEYIRQNPYRLAVRKARPDFFRKTRNIYINGRQMQAYGNLFLLRNPFKSPLVVHRADDEATFKHKLDECLYYAHNGGVVVSAFISPREKAVRKEIETANGNIILIHHRPFTERQKPSGHDFDLCCAGKLLMLSPLEYLNAEASDHPSRSQCLDMNALAKNIPTCSCEP